MRVQELMIKDVIMLHETDSIEVLIRTMVKHRIGGAPVVNEEGKLTGFISDGDVLRAISPKQQNIYDFYSMISAVRIEMTSELFKDLLEKKVKDLMKKRNIRSVLYSSELDAVLRTLSHEHIKKIPVIDDERRVVGIISRSDVIRYIGEQAIGQE
ncbi:CBS domain-containing protein [Sporolactobacillus shoreae]|uniref:CBS domain-containing protein n=1 Tax=Sporolactobacillus shoreae TaxID=1465501 RepID=A0A4Z0GUF8_9BACL|nr:CBS domain-containing protein [Sporolactobacillus shoreae]TGB00348.1 CBS domain-containing protein [Sporolactobacillus shoreae]